MGFGTALFYLRRGWLRLRRRGWNGSGMWIQIQDPHPGLSKMTLPYIYMRTMQGDLVPWVPSQTDLLAYDWELVGE